ncbi:MAG TPA: lipid II flippase MurJ [Bryobacteraceae bacterium]|nr:lipid II flippase MurJ [Bryobacteraceae bacterium]
MGERMFGRAAGSPIVRGGLALSAGLITGNLIGFFRVALTAYLLGTHSAADALAVAVGPIDTLNSVLINTMIFAFVPMLTEREGAARVALFRKLNRVFTRVFLLLTISIMVFAPWLISVLAPGLDAGYVSAAVTILRITSVSTLAAGAAALQSAFLFTHRRFAATAFNQAALNFFTIAGALSLWRTAGVYGFAIGYAVGAWAQLGIVYFAARSSLRGGLETEPDVHWRALLARPASFLLYAGLIALNVIVTRAYATHAGTGMAAALDYSMRCLTVPLAYLITPVSNSLLPEIARLRSRLKFRQAFRLMDKTIALVALLAVAGCAVGIALRTPLISLLFERGSFTAQSTQLVSAVFLGFAPSLIGWSLLELTSRSLFALDRPQLALRTVAIPVVFNLAFVLLVRSPEPQWIGLGASLGFIIAFVLLFSLVRVNRRRWLEESAGDSQPALETV